MKAYLDVIGGVSGDMLLGAILSAGITKEELIKELKLLRVDGWDISTEEVVRGAVQGCLVNVKIEQNLQSGFNFADFINCVHNSQLLNTDKEAIYSVIRILEQAENNVHGVTDTSSHTVHLHELGSLDTLIDITGAVVGLRLLGVKTLICSPLPIATGWSYNQHGRMPATALATQSIVTSNRIPIKILTTPPDGESVTPTGAAIVAALGKFTTDTVIPSTVGYGAGSKNTSNGPPNVVSLWVCRDTEENQVVLLETNIDNTTGEVIGYTVETLMSTCALDAWVTPIYMKKNRPAVTLSALVTLDNEQKALEIIMKETPTLGVKRRLITRYTAQRSLEWVNTPFGDIQVKVKRSEGKIIQITPEYEICRKIAKKSSTPLSVIMLSAIESYAK